MTSSFVLVEANSDINYIKTLDPNSKFISFDIVAHNRLQNLGIKHNLIEDYFSNEDKSIIDEKTINICYKWYKQKSIAKFLEYDDVNLGWLLEIELFSYVIQAIKKFVGIINLLQKENPCEIHSSNFLLSMVNQVNQNNDIKLKTISITSKSLLYFDNIEIPVNIGGKLIPFRVSRKSAIKLKKIVENFTNIFFNFKTDLSKLHNRENLLFLDFNPILYEEMLKEFSETNFNILLLNERRPAIWNFSSFKLLKKLNCKIISLQDFKDNETTNKIKIEQNKFQNQLKDIFSNEEHFKNYFTIMGFSFWSAIKEDFISFCNNRFSEAIQRLILSKKLFSNLKINSIIVMYNTGVEEKAILSQSNKKNIPGILLQHGYLPRSTFNQKYLDTAPIIPNLGLSSGVWGNFTKSLLEDLGVSENNIQVVGSPRHDTFFKAKKYQNNNDTILFTESFANEVDFVSFDSKNDLKNEEIIGEMLSFINDLQEYKLIVKLHPGKHVLPYSLKPLVQSIDPTIPIYQSKNILDLLKNCKLVIASEMTTVIIEAMILKIPTMVYFSHPKYSVDEPIFKNKASIRVETFEQFKSEIDKLLNDLDYRNMIIANGTNFINEQFINQGYSSKEFVKLFQK